MAPAETTRRGQLWQALEKHLGSGRVSRVIYGALHHEPFRPDAADWKISGKGPLSAANGALPWILFVSVLRSLRGRAIPARAWISLPVMWLLCAVHAAGELTGLLRGEGPSARRLN